MKSGFTDFVATRLVPDHPGQTARWYAEQYLELGDKLSDSPTPVQSLANTLQKQVKTGREKRIRRERVGGQYRYFPVSAPSAVEEQTQEVFVQIHLFKDELVDIDGLISVEKFKNRNEAIKWLVVEGIKANREYLDKVSDVTRQIEELKRQADSL